MLLSVTPAWAPNISSIADLSQLILLNNDSIPEEYNEEILPFYPMMPNY